MELIYIIDNIEEIKSEINRLNRLLDNISDLILTNQIIYEIKANEEKCRYLYKVAKDNNISSYKFLCD